MNHAIKFHQTGGPEVLRWEAVDLPAPAAHEALIRHQAIGVNYIDTYHRSGLYPLPLPSGVGVEGAGVVEAIGEGVSEVAVGDRVAYVGGTPGSYSERRVYPADRLVKLPDFLSFEQAAAVMLQGLTAQFLLRQTYRVKAGDTILVHAAAGGVGTYLCQWAKARGATVIGTVGSDAKAKVAHANGCDHTIVYTRENFTQRLRELTGGAGVPVVYDSVGRDTFMGSLDCLAPLGMMVSFGNATGPVEAFNLGLLAQKGSLFVTRPTLFTYCAKREALLAMAADLFAAIQSGAVRVSINQRFALADAEQAHRALEARQTTGSTVLVG